jgi:hypothetical protein
MQRLRLLNTLGVFYALLCASTLLVVQNGYACSWQAELIDSPPKRLRTLPLAKHP